MRLLTATNAAIRAAGTQITEQDSGAVEALRILAREIDRIAADPHAKLDNVIMPTYFKYSDALGLTPAGRKALAEKAAARQPGKLKNLRGSHLRSAS